MKRSREADLARQYHAGDSAAGWAVVEGIGDWISRQARRYSDRYQYPYDDLRSDGRLVAFGLLASFDPAKGRFLSWVNREIRRRMSVYGQMAGSPVATSTTAGRVDNWKRTARNMASELGRAPTTDEVGDRLGSSYATRSAMRRLMTRCCSVDEIMARESTESSPGQYGVAVDLFRALSDNGDAASETYRRCDEGAVVGEVRAALADMSKREMVIVRARLMSDDDDRPTLAGLGELLGISRERVRQLEIQIIARLRKRLGVGR